MKAIITLILTFPLLVSAQIDYRRGQMDRITSKDSTVTIPWIMSAGENTPLYFDHVLRFYGDDDIVGSTVDVYLFHNNDTVRCYKSKTSEHLENFITLDQPLKVKKGDKIYFVLKLKPRNTTESYMFNIEPILIMKDDKLNTQLTKKSVVLAKQSEPLKKQVPTKRTYQVPWIGRKIFGIREPIGSE